MTSDPDIRLPNDGWKAANDAADRLPAERQGELFVALSRELAARLEAAGRYDKIAAESAVEVALRAVLARRSS